jgi:RNA-directed DNA polymerase
MNKIINDWQEFFLSQNIKDDTLQSYLAYLTRLVDHEVPIIFEIEHLSLLLGVDYLELLKIINSPESFYRLFEIPKRNGGLRTISMPYPTLLHIQHWIKTNILEKVLLHDCAHGFVKKKSILTNASIHVGKSIILKMDISDFFPSINLKRVISIFRRFGYSKDISFYLSSLCTLKDQLPQGAATSPMISNIIAKKFDHRLNNLANSLNLSYSRYADDLTFSGDYISYKFVPIVKKIIEEEGFRINDSKTKLLTGSGKKIVTGISISSHSLKLPKSRKRQLRQQGYYLSKYPGRIIKEFHGDPFYIDRMIGKFNFWLQIEPENKFALDTINNLKKISASILQYTQ